MLFRKLVPLIFLFFLTHFFSPSPLYAQNAVITDMRVTVDKSNVLLWARVTNCFKGDIEDAILAGVPTTFTFTVHLYKEFSWLPDKKLKSVKINHTIKYDNIKKTFSVSVDNQKTWETFGDFEKAKRRVSDISAWPLVDDVALKKTDSYYVRMRVKLDEIRLPLHLEYLFFFVSTWEFETDWQQARVIF